MRKALYSILCFSLLLAPVSYRAQDKFQPNCPPPFEDPPNKRQVDIDCGNEGTFTDNDTPEHHAQNHAKNNLCAVGSTGAVGQNPIHVTVTTFDSLQASLPADVVFGDSAHLPQDRDRLKNVTTSADGVSIGEGSYVVFVGFMLEAHPAGKESVSCQSGKVGFLDIHIALAASKTASVCKSVTAEIIPHYRPQSWPQIYYQEHYAEIKAHPVRLKGQLFFDGSHRTCDDPQRSTKDPMRRSDWEIHPVYSVDVCSNKSLSGCRFDDESVWTRFADWIDSQ